MHNMIVEFKSRSDKMVKVYVSKLKDTNGLSHTRAIDKAWQAIVDEVPKTEIGSKMREIWLFRHQLTITAYDALIMPIGDCDIVI